MPISRAGISRAALDDSHGRSKRDSGLAGFTLIELLITLSIAAILMGVMAPKITALFPDTEEKTSTRLRQVIMKARWLAARDQVPVRVIFDLQRQEIILSQLRHGRKRVLSSIRLPAEMKMVGFWNMSMSKEGKFYIRFLPDGRGSGFGLFLERGTTRMTAIGYPFRSGVAFIPGWVESEQNG